MIESLIEIIDFKLAPNVMKGAEKSTADRLDEVMVRSHNAMSAFYNDIQFSHMHVVIFQRSYSVQQLLDQSIPFFRFFVVRSIRIVRNQFEHISESQYFRDIIN